MMSRVDDDEKLIAVCDVTNSYTTSKSRNTQEMWFLTEDGLYINRLKRIYDLNTSDVFKEWWLQSTIKRFRKDIDFIDLKSCASDPQQLKELNYTNIKSRTYLSYKYVESKESLRWECIIAREKTPRQFNGSCQRRNWLYKHKRW